LFEEGLSDRLEQHPYLQKIAEELQSDYRGISEYDKSLYHELKTRLPNYILLRGDRNSMAHSVELRMPYLDNKVLANGYSIPPCYKMLGLSEKYILKRAFRNLLPTHVRKRTKFAFNAPTPLLWQSGSAAYDMISNENIQRSGVFDPKQVKTLCSEALNPKEMSADEAKLILTGVLSVQILHDEFIGKKQFPEQAQGPSAVGPTVI